MAATTFAWSYSASAPSGTSDCEPTARTWRFVEEEELARVRKEWEADETV